MFIVYVNDLSRRVKNSSIFKFADDLKWYTAIYSINDSNLLQSDLNSLYGWSVDNLLSFSIKKYVVLHFKCNFNVTTDYSINGTVLTNVTKHRDLGIVFSSNLSWADRIEAIVAKAYKSFGLLRRTFKHTFSIQTKRTLYLTLVRSKLLYCSPLWRPYLIKESRLTVVSCEAKKAQSAHPTKKTRPLL